MLHGKWGFARKETGNEEERGMKRGENSSQTHLGERSGHRQRQVEQAGERKDQAEDVQRKKRSE